MSARKYTVDDDRLTALIDAGGVGATEPEAALMASELLARRAGERQRERMDLHRLVDDTLTVTPSGVVARCVCGWRSRPCFSPLIASCAFEAHRIGDPDVRLFEPSSESDKE